MDRLKGPAAPEIKQSNSPALPRTILPVMRIDRNTREMGISPLYPFIKPAADYSHSCLSAADVFHSPA